MGSFSFKTTRRIQKGTPEWDETVKQEAKRMKAQGMKSRGTNNPNGRPPGTPNKVTSELRILLRDMLSGEIEKIPEYLGQLSTEKRMEFLVRLMPYAVPKIEAVSPAFGEPGFWDDVDEALGKME